MNTPQGYLSRFNMLHLPITRPGGWLTVSFALIAGVVRADLPDIPERTDYPSSNGNYVFRVTPDVDWPDRNGWCLGELSRREDGEATVVWRRYLVNNLAPAMAVVSDSGSYVATLDEWGRIGKLPIVVYGFRGELIRVHSLESLFGRMEIPGTWTVSSVLWRENGLVFFGPKDASLFVRLSTGQTLMIDLKSGDLMDYNWFEYHDASMQTSLLAFGRERSGVLALEYLRSDDARERQTGAMVAGQLGVRAAIPRLRELLTDEAESLTMSGLVTTRHRYVADAAKEALTQMGEKP